LALQVNGVAAQRRKALRATMRRVERLGGSAATPSATATLNPIAAPSAAVRGAGRRPPGRTVSNDTRVRRLGLAKIMAM
jgi:hypothetical protein